MRISLIASGALALFGCSSSNNAPPDAPAHDAAIDAAVGLDAPHYTQTGTTTFPLTSVSGGIEYTADIAIGGQTFALAVDTGSTTLAVAGSACPSCNVTPAYTPDAEAIDQHTTASSTYGDGSMWTGENYADLVGVMGDDPVAMRFSAMTKQSGFFRAGLVNQGLIGFAGSQIALPGTDSYIAKREEAGLSDEFAFQFCPDKGTLWFGGYDSAAVASPPQFAPLTPNVPYFEVQVDSAGIGSGDLAVSGTAILDSGTSVMIVSTAAANALKAAVEAAPGYAGIFGTQQLSESSCLDPGASTRADIDAALPAMSFTLPQVGGGTFTLALPATQSYLLAQQGTYCLGVAAVPGLPTILGDTFLRQFVTIFDLDNEQMGFAPQSGCTLPPSAVHRVAGPTQPPPWVIRGRPRSDR